MQSRERYKIPIFDLRYKHMEFALAEVLKIQPEQLPAFRARLRHLRNIGMFFEKPGKGSHASYTGDNALELLLTLQLNIMGYSPAAAAAYTAHVMKELPDNFLSDNYKGNIFAIIFTEGGNLNVDFEIKGDIYYGNEQLKIGIQFAPPAFSIIKITDMGKALANMLAIAVREA